MKRMCELGNFKLTLNLRNLFKLGIVGNVIIETG